MLFDGGRVSHPCSQFFWRRVICHMSLELPFDGYQARGMHFYVGSSGYSFVIAQ